MVTPLAGVWIEITILKHNADVMQSLPLRECGLKSLKQKMLAQIIMSLPLRECGLKYF